MPSRLPSTRSDTRRNALEKLAALSAQSAAVQDGEEDIARLCELQRPRPTGSTNGTNDGSNKVAQASSVPMSVRELEVLVALCKAAPLVQTTKDAARLVEQLAPYVSEAHKQVLGPSLLHQHSPPLESLAYDLTSAVLALGLNHPSLRSQVFACIDRTLEELTMSAESASWITPQEDGVTEPHVAEKAIPAIQLTVSILGFLDAVAKYVQVWTPEQRVSVIQRARSILSERFMVSLEGALSAIRNARTTSRAIKEWKRWIRHYATKARPLGAMLLEQALMSIVEESAVLLVGISSPRTRADFLDTLVQRSQTTFQLNAITAPESLESMTQLIADEIGLLQADVDYLRVSSAWQQRLVFVVKASSLRSFLYCSLVDARIAKSEVLLTWLDTIAADPVQMADDELAQTVLKCMTVLAETSPATAANLTRSLPRLIVQGGMTTRTATLAGDCLARVLDDSSQDIVISTLYWLGNNLSSHGGADMANGVSPFVDGSASVDGNSVLNASPRAMSSVVSLNISDIEETAAVYGSIVQAIVAITTVRNDPELTALVISMLVQKVSRVSATTDAKIITEMAALGLCGGPDELRALLRTYSKVASGATTKHDLLMMEAVTEGRLRLAMWISKTSPLYEVYLTHLLSLCVGSGDTAGERTTDVALTSKMLSQLFRPLAVLVSTDPDVVPQFEQPDELSTLSRNAWFNIVAHGFTLNSLAAKDHTQELQVLAQYTLPLVDEERVDMPDSGIDLNTVLRRGDNAQHNAEQRSSLIAALPRCETDIKSLSYPECVFLNAALLVSTMRARSGDCTAVIPYFMESKVKSSATGNCMLAIALSSVDVYLQRVTIGRQQSFAAPQVALQLVAFFEGACHRISKVQQAAVSSADIIVNQIPSALCQKASLFALLELLSLMWKSCLDMETDEYAVNSRYHSEKGKVTLQLSDDLNYRQTTLTNFHRRCRLWVTKAIEAAPLDVKGLLQAYLEDYEDDGAYGRIALGRSFAVEMGSVIPNSDNRLMSLDRQRDLGINTASDFVAQYTTRQEYRHRNNNLDTDEDWAVVDYNGVSDARTVQPTTRILDEVVRLQDLAQRLRKHEAVPFPTVRDTLRDAAGILSSSPMDHAFLIPDLVAVPFAIFTKQSITQGISLWLSVVKENPSLESRILAEVAAGWEGSVRLHKGFFAPYLHLDPFYIKEEFAPSNWEAISKRQQLVQSLISPHLRLTQFLSSHFSASRLTSPSVERVYARLMRVTLLTMKRTIGSPLAREVHFHIVLLALKVLKYSTRLDTSAQWRLKDAILSAGLAWFAMPPRWSFGSNRLQVKAEVKVLDDVSKMLHGMSSAGARDAHALASLQPKQELLTRLMQQELGRLTVWITPLGPDSRGLAPSGDSSVDDALFSSLLSTAWYEDPRIAVQLATRFPQSERLRREIRSFLLREPYKAIDEPDALQIMLGTALPSDVKAQLRYLLYWAPINPMAAVTYLMPAYGNNALIIQYAVRALESHSIDITFFYVPQIVQTLRYDALGYVERYILEAATFSQLFAHQIIWNIKANAYKNGDEEAGPDPAKPLFDKVMDGLILSFSKEDKDFYVREFDFFGKVTGISGTLKPFIKRPKPERKQIIEDELRKIEVDVGVYLPSNPDGVVIGIDRKSGKPLQSHAKAPFIATFRIRKEDVAEVAEHQASMNGELVKRQTHEIWQSAIFKVGDDCRQDVLALQMIAAFRGIFNTVGLDVYVFPYRVTATAPGCGVIDVLPNSISRDMMGREAVNGLYEYFVSKFGSEDSIRFQEARSNFIKSMAAYSILSYLLQFKDRHNGNIMVDAAGHILHIDFGFIFSIAPGGGLLERAPFKLSAEMIAVMGGLQSQPFRAFEELCVKVFLASRQHVEQLSHIVLAMLDSGLPCFKPASLSDFKERFALEKSDREAADFVRTLVHHSANSYRTRGYDYFQLKTNGIPY